MKESKDKTAAERQRRYRQNRMSGGFTRVQLYVPDSAVDQLTEIAETLTKNQSARFTEITEAAQTKTRPLPLTKSEFDYYKATDEERQAYLAERRAARQARLKKDRYQHPQIKSLMWHGCGRQPPWVRLWIEQGGKLEELENKGVSHGLE